MDFRILGPLEVDDGGHPVALGGARQRALLAILLLRRGEVVSAERLVEDLYGGRPPATAAKSLQAHVSRLRKALGDGRLVTRAPGYVLQTAPEEVDADRFAHLAEMGRRALAAADADRAEALLVEALGLWRGSALGDLSYEEFAQSEVARLEELRLICLEELAEARLASGRDAELIPELERLVAEHPLRERLRGRLMLALYRSGRQADALAVYQDGRRTLVDELGIEPGRALQDLERAILNQEPSLDLAQRPRATAVPPEGSSPGGSFVGRARELAQLDELLDGVIAGTGRLAVVSGEAGIGKSRLVEELGTRARRLGIRVLVGRCWEAGGAPAFWPWVQALRGYVRETPTGLLREQLGTAATDVAQLLPELREMFVDIPETEALESEGARFRLFDSTAAFVRRAAEDQPMLVVLDDVHAADPASLLLISFVAGELSDAHAAVVATYREPELDPAAPEWAALADLVRRAGLRVSLRGLGEPEVADYIRQVADEPPSRELVAAIAAETAGNPLFVGEIVRLLATEGTLPIPSGDGWRPTIPETVREVIDRRLQRLTPGCRAALATASVIGRDFSLTVLEPLLPIDRDELLDRLDEAVEARLVVYAPGSRSELRFAHALVRDTLYDELSAAHRRDLHRRAADTLAHVVGHGGGARLTEIAHHYFQALPSVEPDVAVEWARRAGDHARDLLAFEEAARLYETARIALSARPARVPEVERALLLALGEAHAGAGDTTRAKEAFLRAAVVARESDAPTDLAAAALGYGGPLVWGRPAGDRLVVPLLEEALAVVPEDEPALRALLLARLAGALRDERDPQRRLAAGKLAVNAAQSSGDATVLIRALLSLSVTQYAIDDPEGRLRLLRELRDVASTTNDPKAEWEALNAEIVLSLAINDFAAVSAQAQRLAEWAKELRQPAARWFAEAIKGLLALHSGDFEGAERLVPSAYALGQQAYPMDSQAAYVIQLYLMRREQGRADEVRDALAGIAAEYPARPFFRCALSSLAVDVGRTTDARRLLDELAPNRFEVVPRDTEWPMSAAFLAETISALGDVDRAGALYEELAPLSERSSANPPEGTIGAIARSLGLLALVVGRRTDAVTHLRRAIEIDEATGATPWAAYAQVELADVLAGDDDEAAVLRTRAAETAASLGMRRLATRLERTT